MQVSVTPSHLGARCGAQAADKSPGGGREGGDSGQTRSEAPGTRCDLHGLQQWVWDQARGER